MHTGPGLHLRVGHQSPDVIWLTTAPGPAAAPIPSRQVVVLPRRRLAGLVVVNETRERTTGALTGRCASDKVESKSAAAKGASCGAHMAVGEASQSV